MEHDKMMEIIHDVFDPALPRLAPGDDPSTRRALEMLFGPGLEGAGDDPRVLDIGCGSGAPTLRLVAELGCRVIAVDNHQPYLDELTRRAEAAGLADRIETRCADMTDLDLDGETFDLVWAEGSAFVMGGVPEALKTWRTYLKPGGALGLTELAWFENGAPDECCGFFAEVYPAMADVASLVASVAASGFDMAGHFSLSESTWWESFYDPLAERMEGYVPPDDHEVTQAVVSMVRQEIETYRRYASWYGYGFLLMRKRD